MVLPGELERAVLVPEGVHVAQLVAEVAGPVEELEAHVGLHLAPEGAAV